MFLATTAGITVASITGSTGAGWAAAAVLAAVVYLIGRRQGGGTCGLPQRKGRPFAGLDTEALHRSRPAGSGGPGVADGAPADPAAPGGDTAGHLEPAER